MVEPNGGSNGDAAVLGAALGRHKGQFGRGLNRATDQFVTEAAGLGVVGASATVLKPPIIV
jgi:hypothetical protein